MCDYSVTQKYPEEVTNVIKSGVAGALAGLVYGGLPAARHARQSYIQVSQAELYSSRVDAVVSVGGEGGDEIGVTNLARLIPSFRSVQSALGAQRSRPRFREVRVEVELEGGCLCHCVQVRTKK